MGNLPDIRFPSQDELDQAWSRFDAEWGAVDEALYRQCRENPEHDDRRAVLAKFILINRTYAAGLERCVKPEPGKQAIVTIVDRLLAHREEVDDILWSIREIREPLDRDSMALVVRGHGMLTDLLKGMTTDGKTPRSFSSKYLHFHCPVVPIYDDYARVAITRLVRWENSSRPIPLSAEMDPEYWNYCVRFFRLYESCRSSGIDFSVKKLDAYLWEVPLRQAASPSSPG